MNIDRRDFIKYGVIGMGATAILGPGAAVAASKSARKVGWGYGGFMKPSGKEAHIADYPLSWWVNKFQLPLHIYSGSVSGEILC